MALVLDDNIKETSTTVLTADYVLLGAQTGFQSFAAVGNGNTTWYRAGDVTDWEVGIGTYSTTGPTLARTTIISSSNADAAVSWGAGTRTIVCTLPSSKAFIGPTSATDNAITRYDGTTGRQVQGSGITIDDSDIITLPNTGLHLLDTNASHDLIIAPGSDLTADRTLTITTGDAARTLTLSGNVTLTSGSLAGTVSSGTHSGTNTGDQTVPVAASQAEQEAGSSTTVFTSPGRQHFHPSAAKFWVKATANSTTIVASYNMTSWADSGVGDADGTIATDFSSANWCLDCEALGDVTDWGSLKGLLSGTDAQAAGTFGVRCVSVVDSGSGATDLASADPLSWFAAGWGDLA